MALAGLIVASGLTALPVAAPGAQALTQLQGGSGYPGDEITVILRASICLIAIMLVWLGDYLLWQEGSVFRRSELDQELLAGKNRLSTPSAVTLQ